MKTAIKRQLYNLYLIIIAYNIVIIHCQVGDDGDLEIVRDISDTILQMQYMQSTMDGSGDTSEISTEITMTSIQTTLSTSYISYSSTRNNTLETSFITSTSSISITTDSSGTHSATTFTSKPDLESCNNPDEVRFNFTCIPKNVGRNISVGVIRSNSSNSDENANALLLYFRSGGNLSTTSNRSDTLTSREVDKLVDELTDITAINFSTFFIMAESVNQGNKSTSLGSASKYNSTKETITNSTKADVLADPDVSVAGIIDNEIINEISRIKMMIIDEPTAYKNLNPSNNQSLVSSVIIASVNKQRDESPVKINLYFRVFNTSDSFINGRYSCSFLDTNTSNWNESGCSEARYNQTLKRYECTCDHLTTFALIWLPNISQPNYLTSQDIASLVFLSISILCFIAVIIHSFLIRFHNPMMSFTARDLLPLISSASTTMLFIFYIALSMTVYTRISSASSTPTPCFTSASVLMFFVYFFLIFMFCVKTSVGYFHYLRFIHLFPDPSFRKLFVLLIISFFISLAWTSFAAGFNSNASYNITQLHGNKLCWFTRDVIYYFMTIPVGIFLLLNFLTIVCIAKRIISHARNATSPHQSYERMKRCVLVLLSSCVTQGIGWLFGPFITFIDPTAANVLGWFFVIFNGLEGVWTILLYIIIRSQRMDESKRVSESRRRIQKIPSISIKFDKERKRSDLDSILARRFRVTHRNARKEKMMFHDLYDEETIDWETGSYEL